MSLIVPYTEKVFTKTLSVNYGSGAERVAFLQEIMDYIMQVSGITLRVGWMSGKDNTTSWSWASVEYYNTDDYMYPSALVINPAIDQQTPYFLLRTWTATGLSTSGAITSEDNRISLYVDAKKFGMRLRWIKSGNSFLFGFGPYTTASVNNGWIGAAFTPVCSVQKPGVVLGYALVAMDDTQIWHSVYADDDPHLCTTSRGYCSRTSLRASFPAVGSESILLRPLFMNAFDYYFEGAYVANVTGNVAQETIIHTDKGIFLVAQWYCVANEPTYPSLVFDITKAFESTESTNGTT